MTTITDCSHSRIQHINSIMLNDKVNRILQGTDYK